MSDRKLKIALMISLFRVGLHQRLHIGAEFRSGSSESFFHHTDWWGEVDDWQTEFNRRYNLFGGGELYLMESRTLLTTRMTEIR